MINTGEKLICKKDFTMYDGRRMLTKGMIYEVIATECNAVYIVNNKGKKHRFSKTYQNEFLERADFMAGVAKGLGL